MEYRRQVQPPGTRHEVDTDDENHSVFDFPPSFTPPDRLSRSARSDRDKMERAQAAARHGKSRNANFPYPSSISIQKSATSSEKRSPTASPSEREFRRGESRQENSPYRPKNNYDAASTDMEQHHAAGQTFFLRNRLSEAVDAYSHAIRAGLDELKHRKEMLSRIGNGRNRDIDGNKYDQDSIVIELGEAIANVHFDMAHALEVCGKYSDAKEEYSNGIGLLQNTCHKRNSDEMLKRAFKNVSRMESGMDVEDQRIGLQEDLESAMRKIENAATMNAKEAARLNAMGCIKRLLRMEREAMGEQCYAVAKLKLKLAKLKCECGELDNGLDDAESAIKTLKSVLGSRHALVGASCSFAASVYEKRVSMISGVATTCAKNINGLTADGKVMINRALELYADTLEPMQFKYNEDDSFVRPDVGEVFHKIGRLYAKKSNHASALDAYHRSLESLGPSHQGFHSDAAIVWHDLAQLHLASREYQDAIDAAGKSTEMAQKVKSSRSQKCSDRVETLVVWNLQIAGDAYSSANRYEEATRSYQDALVELKRSQPNSNSSRNFAVGPLDESRLLKRIGMTLLKQNKIDDAKVSLIDALRVMRLDRDSERSRDMPVLMADLGALHLKTHDHNAALAVLRPCLKLYAEQGVSDYSSEVQKARDLFKRAQAQSSGRLEFSERDSLAQQRHESSPARNVTAATPRTQVTAVTLPSTNPSSTQSNMSPRQLTFSPDYSPAQHGREKELSEQLDQVKSELARAKEAHRSELSRLNDSHKMEVSRLKESHASIIREKEMSLSSELDCAKREIARLKEEHGNEAAKLREVHTMGSKHQDEVKSLSIQLDKKITELAQCKEAQSRDAFLLQEAEDKLKQAKRRLKEVEAERDEEKKERVQTAISLRSEVDSAVAKARSEMAVQMETLKKELSVSESSYQQILRAIDQEKEELGKSHDTKIRELMAENRQLRKELEDVVESSERESTEQSKKIMQENGLLKYDNRNLRGDKEALTSEVAELKKKLEAKSNEKSNEAVIAEKLRKAELELESEKRRRAILESELENDSRQVPMQMPGYPMFGQFGYPPMMNYNTERSDKKSRLLEVDLAAERENKEVLEKTVAELTAALEKEKHALKTQRESLVATHEREMNEVFVELKKKEDDVAELSDIANEFHSVVEELSRTKEQLVEKSKLADAYEKTRDDLLNEKRTSAALSADLANVQGSLEQKVKEYDDLIDQHQRMKKLHDEVSSYYESEIEQLKTSNKQTNELLEAKIATIEEMKSANRLELARLEEEMSETSTVHRAHIARLEQELAEVSATLKSEMDNLVQLKAKELSESKSQLKNALQELQSVYSAKEIAEQETRELRLAFEENNEEFTEVLANNEALCVDLEGLRSISERSEKELDEAKDRIKSLTLENSNLEIEMDRMQAQLSDIKQENAMYEEQFADLERVLDQMDSKLVNAEGALQESEAALKAAEDKLAVTQRDIDAREKDAESIYDKYTELETSFHRILSSVINKFDTLLPVSEISSLESLEEKKIHITTLATLISNQMKENERQIEEVNFNMSNALRELDTLESKYKQTRADLAASMDACKNEQQLESDYDELMRYCADLENTVAESRDLSDQIRKLQIERKLQQEEISGLKEAIEQHVEALKAAEDQRDVFQSRLKEAVDDLEELENERNELRRDLDKTYTESAKLESSLRVKIDCLEGENERLMQLEGQNLQRDAEAWDKDNKIKELQKQLEIANNALDILRPAHITSSPEGSSKKRSYSLNGDEMYPDLLPSNVDVCDELASLRSVIKALESQNMKLSEKLADLQGASPKMNDQMVQTLESSMDIPPPPPLPVQNAAVQTMESSTDMDDVLSLKTRLSELIDQNDALTLQIDELKHEAATKKAEDDADRAHEKRKLHEEISSLTTKVQHLQEINDDLSLKVNESQAELVKAAERDGEKLGSLQKEVDNLKQQNRVLKHDLNEISSRSQYSAEANKDNMSSEKEEMLQEITSLRDHIQTLEEYNEELSSQLVELQEAVADITSRERDAVADEIQALQCQVEALETNNKQLSAKLEESRAETVNASQVEVEHRQEIASLRKALDEKNAHIHDDCKRELDNQKQHHQAELEALKSKLNQPQQEDMSGIHDACKRALEDHKEKHQAEVQNLKSQIYHLQDSNNANQEDISLLQIDLQNALNDCDENEIRHQQELSTVNMEFTNALNSLEYLQKENKRLKLDIQSLSDMSKMSHHGGEAPDSDAAYFEKEISAAHARFVSMEKSLQDRIERLEGEKYKLIMAHKDEIEKKDIAFEKVRVELSAWKLEMQNALNDIEGIKRERNELEQQIAVYKASLDALSSAGEDGQLDDFVGGN